ncbi:MAG: hypothetical protein H6953_03125 [Chromatiaceae bacterium]|nr:hypothetical protein [Chromatiaceae bacterium]MCP5314144.1 hypothetical protein [Chromatiaceae bacterium]
MKALLIDPAQQTVTDAEVEDATDIQRLIGFDTIESDAVGATGDRLYFDEECFIRGTTGRFQIDTVIPVAGKGVIVGTDADGNLRDVQTTAEELRGRIKFQ